MPIPAARNASPASDLHKTVVASRIGTSTNIGTLNSDLIVLEYHIQTPTSEALVIHMPTASPC